MSDRFRVAIVSHGHPEYSKGGTQTASYSLFLNLKSCDGVEPIYLARSPSQMLGHAGDFALFRGRRDEVLWSPPAADPFRLVTTLPSALKRQVSEFCARMAPDIVHVHHYIGAGTDLFRFLKADLGIPLICTLHEYLAICNHHGQMLKTNGQLCYTASHAECSACFPDRSSGMFFLRKALVMENLSHVDLFIAPSEFLAQRYIEWGIEADRIRVIENPIRERCGEGDRPLETERYPKPEGAATRFAYFGQFTPNKGLDVLLDAIALLDDELKEGIKVVLFGFNLNPEGDEIQRRIALKVEALKTCVVVRGVYRNDDVLDLMRSVDWVVVPSIWWENSPVVIQEAKAAGVPVLCSDIGGMREKVRPGVDGAHFRASDSVDLADKIGAICRGELTVERQPSPDQDSATAQIVDAYRAVLANSKRSREDATLMHDPQTYSEFWNRYVDDFGESPDHAGLTWPGDEWGDQDRWRVIFNAMFLTRLPHDTKTAIEVGPGSGKYTLMFLDAFPMSRVIAADVSANYLKVLLRRCGDFHKSGRLDLFNIGTNYAALDEAAQAAGIRPRTLDVMFSIDAMVHVDLQYLAAYWLSAAKLLRPGGKIIMSVADATREKGHNRLVQDTPSLFPLQGQQTAKFEWLCQELVQSVLGRLGFDVIDAMPDSDRDFFFVATKRS